MPDCLKASVLLLNGLALLLSQRANLHQPASNGLDGAVYMRAPSLVGGYAVEEERWKLQVADLWRAISLQFEKCCTKRLRTCDAVLRLQDGSREPFCVCPRHRGRVQPLKFS
jgi:hypothetical protein